MCGPFATCYLLVPDYILRRDESSPLLQPTRGVLPPDGVPAAICPRSDVGARSGSRSVEEFLEIHPALTMTVHV